MKAFTRCVYVFVFIAIFIIYVLWDERNTIFNLKYGIVREALQNYEEPIMEFDTFLDKIRDTDDATYGESLKNSTKNSDDFLNSDMYFNPEVAQDIKYFNNATHLLVGLKLNNGELV